MATIVQEGGREVSIGRVFSRAFGTIGAYPAATIGIAFVFGALPAMILYAALPLLPRVGLASVVAAGFAVGALDMAFAAVVQGAVTLTVLHHEEGRAADIVDTLPPALTRLVPLMLLGLIVGFGFTFGLVLLIVPGILLSVIWWVAAPAMVAERLGVNDALGRSVSLTDGARWAVFGAELVLGVGSLMFNAVLKAAGLSVNSGLLGPAPFGPHGPLLPLIIFGLVQTVTLAVYAAVHASFYLELRTWKEGPATDALAEVFG